MHVRALTLLAAGCILAACDRSAPAPFDPPQAPDARTAVMPQSSRYGVVVTGGDTAFLRPAMDALVQAGVGWVRYTAYWNELQPDTPEVAHAGDWHTARLDALKQRVEQARRRGLNVFVTLERTPRWVQRCDYDPFPGCGQHQYPPHDDNYVQWINFLTTMGSTFSTFPHDVQAWGIWNEPNDTNFFRVRSGRDPIDEYRKFLWYGVAELRSYGGKIVAPDLGQGAGVTAWLDRILANESHRFDVVAVHQYNSTGCTEKDMVQVKSRASAYGKAVWLTEAGYAGPSRATQTRRVTGVLEEMQDGGVSNNDCWSTAYNQQYWNQDADWDKTFVYHLYSTDDGQHPNTNLGTLSGSFTPHPAFTCLRWFAGGRAGAAPAGCVRDAATDQ